MLNVAVCGGSGYAGAELLKILANHPKVNVTAVTSEQSAGKPVTSLFPHLVAYKGTTFEPLAKEALLDKADLFFLALPHKTSQGPSDFFLKKGKKVVDLSADYRLRDHKVYEEWYKTPHEYRATIKEAVYGLSELYRNKVAKTSLVACPGCYPTSAILGLYPFLKAKLLKKGSSIIIDSKSGTSGAGRQSSTAFTFCEVNEGFKAYGIGVHRHTPEIEQEISAIVKAPLTVDFTPHLLPVDRGILTTIYVKTTKLDGLHKIYQKAYANEPFIHVLDAGEFPNIKHVRGTNFCMIGLKTNPRTGTAIIVTAIDNLVKGAAGQAVQNMNIMMGFKETTGLDTLALAP